MRENFKSVNTFKEELPSILSAVIMMIIGALLMSCSFSTLYTPATAATETLAVTATVQIPDATLTQPPPSVTPLPTLGVGSTFIRSTDDAVMVYVPEGEFTMGSNEGGADEKPEHAVFLIEYWIDQTEVTNGMYEKCYKDGACRNPGTSQRASKYDDYPVASINWIDAKSYCSWAGARLPTEAQWEKAARGTDGRSYPWGNELDPAKYYLPQKPSNVALIHKPVGSYPLGASPYGVLDMTGSVFEWINDMYSATYYLNSPSSNPIGATDLENSHFYRGGDYVGYDLRVFSRTIPSNLPEAGWLKYVNVGFRCAMDVDS
jgi:formylglycine-generating enzyme required for sulfatase activity